MVNQQRIDALRYSIVAAALEIDEQEFLKHRSTVFLIEQEECYPAP